VVVTASDLMVHKRRLGFESAYTATRLYCCWLCRCRSRASQPRCHGASLAVANNNAVHPLYRRFRAPLARPLSSASVAIKIAETRPKNGDEGRSRNGNRIDSKQGQLAFSSCTSQSHQTPFLFEPRVETVDGIFWRSNNLNDG
jgi:hypothetical protein